jgi:hypothetical protein
VVGWGGGGGWAGLGWGRSVDLCVARGIISLSQIINQQQQKNKQQLKTTTTTENNN